MRKLISIVGICLIAACSRTNAPSIIDVGSGGFHSREFDRASVCTRTPQITQAIEIAMGKPCARIIPSDLAKIETLKLRFAGISALQPGDFQYLSGLQILDLSYNAIAELPEGVFAPLTSLRKLELQKNEIQTLSASAFAGLAALERVDLMGNRISTLGAGGLAGFSRLSEIGYWKEASRPFALHLSGNPIEAVEAGFLAGAQFARVDLCVSGSLGFNRIRSLPRGAFDHATGLRQLRLCVDLTDAPEMLNQAIPQWQTLEGLTLEARRSEYLGPSVLDGLRALTSLELRLDATPSSEIYERIGKLPMLRTVTFQALDGYELPDITQVSESMGKFECLAQSRWSEATITCQRR